MSKQGDVTRREFMAGAAAGVAAGAAGTRTAQAQTYKSILPQTVLGANEKIRSGHIGLGGMGKRDLQFVMLRDDIQPIMVCDLYPGNMEQATQIITSGKQGYPAPAQTQKFEDVIANKDVDVVVVVTPDHWHTIPTMMAIEAGKDVYCEKPLCTTLGEAQAVRAVVKNSKQVYQSGTMQRSGVYFQEAVKLVQDGHIGKVARVECWNNDWSTIAGIGNKKVAKPDWLDWDRYLGWTPKVPFDINRYLYNFRWFTDYSGGKITDWGAHLVDIAIWAMGQERRPKTVTAASGKLVLTDNRTTPDTLDVLWEFDDYILSFSNRAWNPDWLPKSPGHGIFFHGTLGSMRVDRTGYEVFPFRENGGCEPLKKDGALEGDMNNGHWQNFVECVRDRKDPICNVDVAYHTMLMCVMGKAAYLAKAKLKWNAEGEKLECADTDAQNIANEWLYRQYQNGWSLKKPYYEGWA